MAFSTLIKASALRGPALKSLANQILRSSSVCVKASNRPTLATPALDCTVSRTSLLTPSVSSSTILNKYFKTSPALQSADGKAHDHVTIWKLERVLSAALLPLIPAALAMPNPVLDTLVSGIIVMHNHWGLEAIVVDYVRPILFGDIGPKIGMGLLYIFSAVTLAGCLNLIYNDVGLANAIIAIWKL